MTECKPARTALVVEDIDPIRRWLCDLLGEVFGPIVVAQASDLRSARRWLAQATANANLLALVDLGLPDGSGVDLIRELRRKMPLAHIIVTTIYEDDAHLVDAMAAGAHGYLLKDRDTEQLANQLRRIDQGEPAISPAIARRIVEQFRSHAVFVSSSGEQGEALTARENEVLQLVGRGLRSAEAAMALGLSKETISTHVKNIYRKLGIASRAEAAREAARRNLA
jgi:DNA-binding NarL/FixJ family response regulator